MKNEKIVHEKTVEPQKDFSIIIAGYRLNFKSSDTPEKITKMLNDFYCWAKSEGRQELKKEFHHLTSHGH
jgi:hypothetical protein